MRDHGDKLSVGHLCRIAGVSRSGFYEWLFRGESNRLKPVRKIGVRSVHVVHPNEVKWINQSSGKTDKIERVRGSLTNERKCLVYSQWDTISMVSPRNSRKGDNYE